MTLDRSFHDVLVENELDINLIMNGDDVVLAFSSAGDPVLHDGAGGTVLTLSSTDVDVGSGITLTYGPGGGPRAYHRAVEEITTDQDIVDSGKVHLVDTSGGSVTVTLSAAPDVGEVMTVVKTASANSVTIARNGNEIDGAASDLNLSNLAESVKLIADSSGNWWTV